MNSLLLGRCEPPAPARERSHEHGRMVAPESYALPYPFPDGRVWAAIRNGVVVNMEYMTLPDDFGGSFDAFRQVTRARLSREGAVWSGEVRDRRFFPKFESSDYRAGVRA